MYNFLINVIVITLNILHFTEPFETVLIDIDDDDDLDIAEINKGLDLFESDIIQENEDVMKTRFTRNALLNPEKLWRNPVPYVLESSLDVNSKGIILQAFERFRLKSCVDFQPRKSEDFYISVRQNRGCYSYVSRVIRSGQVVSIGRRCDRIGIVQHEFLHALGFHHEQSRFDRDQYVTINWKNIRYGSQHNFKKVSRRFSTTFNAPYDYLSILHYGKYYFSKDSRATISTKNPKFQDEIGQRIEMSQTDVYKLNQLYKCNSSVSFLHHCDFSKDLCGMKVDSGWRRVRSAAKGPGYFLHTSSDAWLESGLMKTRRTCQVQCLQFFYNHGGSSSDQLNIWIREFQDQKNSTGTLRLMAQISGEPTSVWQFHKVPLNATQRFQVVFEVRNGKKESSSGNKESPLGNKESSSRNKESPLGNKESSGENEASSSGNKASFGGFSIDDINLVEAPCPHHIWRIQDFEQLLKTSDYNSPVFSPRFHSREGFAFQLVVVLRETFFGLYFRLVSGDRDGTLDWPCSWRQLTVVLLDKNPHVQQQMNHQASLTTNPAKTTFQNPREVGRRTRTGGEVLYVNPAYGWKFFMSLEQVQRRDFLKGGSLDFLFSLRDISSLQKKDSLSCPELF